MLPKVPLKIVDPPTQLKEKWDFLLSECTNKLLMTLIDFHRDQISNFEGLAQDTIFRGSQIIIPEFVTSIPNITDKIEKAFKQPWSGDSGLQETMKIMRQRLPLPFLQPCMSNTIHVTIIVLLYDLICCWCWSAWSNDQWAGRYTLFRLSDIALHSASAASSLFWSASPLASCSFFLLNWFSSNSPALSSFTLLRSHSMSNCCWSLTVSFLLNLILLSSLSLKSDQDSFLSTDQVYITLWLPKVHVAQTGFSGNMSPWM